MGADEDLTIVKKYILKWNRHVSRSGQNHFVRHNEKGKKTRQNRGRGEKTTSRNGQAWSLPSPRGQWRTAEETGCKAICSDQTTLSVKVHVDLKMKEDKCSRCSRDCHCRVGFSSTTGNTATQSEPSAQPIHGLLRLTDASQPPNELTSHHPLTDR